MAPPTKIFDRNLYIFYLHFPMRIGFLLTCEKVFGWLNQEGKSIWRPFHPKQQQIEIKHKSEANDTLEDFAQLLSTVTQFQMEAAAHVTGSLTPQLFNSRWLGRKRRSVHPHHDPQVLSEDRRGRKPAVICPILCLLHKICSHCYLSAASGNHPCSPYCAAAR